MIVVIGSNQWTCSLASTPTELTAGLSGQESLPPGEGMLFDLGVDYSHIDINMTEMLFPLDIVFINSNQAVVGVLHDVQPNDEAYFIASDSLGARYFLEVNAGEAASVNIGDEASVTGITNGFDANTILGYTVYIMVIITMINLVIKSFKNPGERLTHSHNKSIGNPGLVQPSRTYLIPGLKTRLDRIMGELSTSRQFKVDRLFEVMEGASHMKRAIQEQRPFTEPLSPLELELKDSFMHNYITYDDYNRYVGEVVAVENYMNLEQWSNALSGLNKLMFSVADVFLIDFPEKPKKDIMDIVKAIWRMK